MPHPYLHKRTFWQHAMYSVSLFSAFTMPVLAAEDAVKLDSLEVVTNPVAPASIGIEESRAEQKLTPGGVTVIDIADVATRNVSSIADMLRYVPGVWAASSTGNDGVFFTSRGSNLDASGFDRNGVKFLQDGLPVTSADGNNHNRLIDPLSASHAEFARGANAMKYGASTLGGALNFVTQTAYDRAPAELYASVGSHGQQITRLTASQVFNEQVDGLVTFETKNWEGFRDHNESDRQGLYANMGFKINDAFSTRFYATYIENDQELSGSLSRQQVRDDPEQANASSENGHFQVDVKTVRIANTSVWEIDENRRLEFGLSYEEQDLFHPIVQSPFFSLLIDTTQRNAGSMVKYHHKIDNHNLLFGVNYSDWNSKGGQYSHNGAVKTSLDVINDNDAYNVEAFMMDRWQISDSLNLILGAQAVRADREVKSKSPATGLTTKNVEDTYHAINPRVGAIYALNQQVDLFASVSRLYEPPTTYQLEDGANAEALEAMQGVVAEIGSRGTKPFGQDHSWSWDVSLFYSELEDEILSEEDPAALGTFITTNVDKTIHAGVEALVHSKIALGDSGKHSIAPMASVTFNHFRFDDNDTFGNNDLPGAPKHVLKGEVIYHHENGFYAGPTMDVVGKRYADFSNSYTVSSYTIFGLRTGWQNDKLSVFVEAQNIFDKDYIATHSVRTNATDTDQILNPGAGASLYAGIEIKM